MTKIDQCVDATVSYQEDIPAIPAITTVRAAKRNVFFPAETDTAIAAVTGNNRNFISTCTTTMS